MTVSGAALSQTKLDIDPLGLGTPRAQLACMVRNLRFFGQLRGRWASVTKPLRPAPIKLVLLLTSCQPITSSEAPARTQIHDSPRHQNPIRGLPGDTITLRGHPIQARAQIAYTRVINPRVALTPPARLPLVNTELSGRLSNTRAEPPGSISAKLPSAMRSGAIYALWIQNPDAKFSAPILINEPKPRAAAPSVLHERALGETRRRLEIVGSNLTTTQGGIRVRLRGPQNYLSAADRAPRESPRDTAIFATLPRMTPGRYSIEVLISGIFYPVPNSKITIIGSRTKEALTVVHPLRPNLTGRSGRTF